ncbi:MAG: disulfide bond formation protein B [Proteobacteria bacterium]|nr:disulfide bond formation protein B [Pseudomonadota bacterium]
MTLDALRSRWPLAALVVSAALLAGAHAFETFGHLAPCPMCLAQREWHWGIVAIALLALIARRQARTVAFILALAYLGSFAMAAWHVAVEQHWVAAQCETGPGGSLVFDLNAKLDIPHCDTPAWTMFGVSMAGYNALISLGMAVLSAVFAFAPMGKE